MRGFVTLDRQPGVSEVAVWTTSFLDREPGHTSAVVAELHGDPRAQWKLRTLTRDAAVVITDGTDARELPLDQVPHKLSDISLLTDSAQALQRRIIDAVAQYARTPLPSSGKLPTVNQPIFMCAPVREDHAIAADTPQHRALAAANFIRAVWSYWVSTDEQRRRRTRSPQGAHPWMMPAELSSEAIEILPARFVSCLRVEPAAMGEPWMAQETDIPLLASRQD